MTEPTDAELNELADACTPNTETGSLNYRKFARAVLAKWGAPQPVACGNCGGTGWMVRDPDIGTDQECFVCNGSGFYSESATPQPTQAQSGAVPLTDEQRNAIYDKHCFLGDNGWEIDWWKVIDEVEAAHGIQGGQHGAK